VILRTRLSACGYVQLPSTTARFNVHIPIKLEQSIKSPEAVRNLDI